MPQNRMRRLRSSFQAWLPQHGYEEKKVFGYPMYFVNRNLFAMIRSDSLVLRLAEEDRQELMNCRSGVTAFGGIEGMSCEEFLAVPVVDEDDPVGLLKWVGRSLRFASALPPSQRMNSKSAAGGCCSVARLADWGDDGLMPWEEEGIVEDCK